MINPYFIYNTTTRPAETQILINLLYSYIIHMNIYICIKSRMKDGISITLTKFPFVFRKLKNTLSIHMISYS